MPRRSERASSTSSLRPRQPTDPMPAHASIVGLAPDRESRAGAMVAAWALGTGFTALLFLGLAQIERREAEAPAADIADLRTVAIAELPPPPPEVRRETTILPTTLPGFEAVPAESPVRVAVPPPDLVAILPPPAAAPPAVMQVGRLYSEFKPNLDTEESRSRIYQRSEVDQAPRVLNRVYPRVPPVVRDNAQLLRTTL